MHFLYFIAPQNLLTSTSLVSEQALDSALDFLQDGNAGEDDKEDDMFDMFDIFEDSPDLDIPHDLIAELTEADANAAAEKRPSASDQNTQIIKAAVERWRRHDKDCGSPEVQIAISHEKVKYLTKHLLANKHDASTRRGLQAIVNHRRKFLNYLYEHDRAKCNEMVDELGIRFRPKKGAFDRESKYAGFKNTKSKWRKLRMDAAKLRDQRAAAAAERTMAQ